MSASAERRLFQDLKTIKKLCPEGISAIPSDENIFLWNAEVHGPCDTPFQKGNFKLKLEFSTSYPDYPPKVSFTSPIFHPNVYPHSGEICSDLIGDKWKPTYDVYTILTTIQNLLDQPNPNSPANRRAAEMYLEEREEYEKTVKSFIK